MAASFPSSPTGTSAASLFAEQIDIVGLMTPNLYTPLLWAFEYPAEAASGGNDNASEAEQHTNDNGHKARIIGALTKGLARLSEACPYLAAKVSDDGTGALIPYRKHIQLLVNDLSAGANANGVGNHSEKMKPFPTMAELKDASFPVQLLDGERLLPLAGLPSPLPNKGQSAASSTSDFVVATTHSNHPVLIVQANFIVGGLLLCIAGEHSVMDGGGMAAVLTLLGAACADPSAPLPSSAVGACNMNKRGALSDAFAALHVPLKASSDAAVVESTIDRVALANLTPSPPNVQRQQQQNEKVVSAPPQWAVARITADAQKRLKGLANGALSSVLTAEGGALGEVNGFFISTNDVMTAFMWLSVLRARAARGVVPATPSTSTTFTRAVDVRSALRLPTNYPGNMTLHTYTSLPLSTVIGDSVEAPAGPNKAASLDAKALAACAAALRRDLVADSTAGPPSGACPFARQMHALVSLLTIHREQYLASNQANIASASASSLLPDGAAPLPHLGIYPGAKLSLAANDLIFSSWAALPCYGLDFGLGLGLPLAVRRPLFAPYEGLMYFLPTDTTPRGEGLVDVIMCLSADDLEILKHDAVFTDFAKWIG